MKVVMSRRLAETWLAIESFFNYPTVLRAAVVCREVNSIRLDPFVKPIVELFL